MTAASPCASARLAVLPDRDPTENLRDSVVDTQFKAAAQDVLTEYNPIANLLSDSVNGAPNVLVSKCFDIVTQAAQTGYALPAGFSCWPGGSGTVVVPASKG